MPESPETRTESGPESGPKERHRRGQIRLAAIIMAATMVIWMGGQVLGGQLGLPPRFVFLLDFAAIAALIWAMSVVFFVWKARRDERA